jgi:5-methylcytosine-specific restriction endonuclease McrA
MARLNQKDWGMIRQQVLIRDNNICQRCKIGEASSASLEVHKKRRRDGGADTPDNLITYCHRCHTTLSSDSSYYT